VSSRSTLVSALQRGDNCLQCIEELLAVFLRHRLQGALIYSPRNRLGLPQYPLAGIGELHFVSSRVFLGAASLEQTLFLHAPDNVGNRRTVDARPLNELPLAQAFVLSNGDKYYKLAGP
jgi:hypothetical protein